MGTLANDVRYSTQGHWVPLARRFRGSHCLLRHHGVTPLCGAPSCRGVSQSRAEAILHGQVAASCATLQILSSSQKDSSEMWDQGRTNKCEEVRARIFQRKNFYPKQGGQSRSGNCRKERREDGAC